MNSIIELPSLPISGQFSITILRGYWTTHKIVQGLLSGRVYMDGVGIGAVIRENSSGRMIARVERANLKLDINNSSNLTFVQNDNIPYFFIIENSEDFWSYFLEPENNAKYDILLAAKHPESIRNGLLFAILKSKENKEFYCVNLYYNYEDKIDSNHIVRLGKRTVEDWINYPLDHMNEYLHILNKIKAYFK